MRRARWNICPPFHAPNTRGWLVKVTCRGKARYKNYRGKAGYWSVGGRDLEVDGVSAPWISEAHDSCKFFLFENPTSTWYSESLFILSEGYNWTGIYAATSGSLKDSKDYCLAQGKTREEKSVRSNRTRKCYSDLTFGTRYVLPMARPSVGSIIYKPKIFRENEGPSSRVHTPAARSCHPHQTNPPSTAHKPHSHHNYPSSAIPRPLPTSHPAS